MKTHTAKGNPVPVRFHSNEDKFIAQTAIKTGLPASEVIRRAVRLARRQSRLDGSLAFLVTLAA